MSRSTVAIVRTAPTARGVGERESAALCRLPQCRCQFELGPPRLLDAKAETSGCVVRPYSELREPRATRRFRFRLVTTCLLSVDARTSLLLDQHSPSTL